jgi:outer membrane protein TolC
MMTWQHMGAGMLLLVGLVGCTVGPNYRAPQVPVPTTWSEGQPAGAEGQAAVTAPWWTTFKDTLLESLLARAVQANLDLHTAVARVREARAQRGVTAADLWPTLNVSGSYTRQRVSEHALTLPSGAVSSSAGGGSPSHWSRICSKSALMRAGRSIFGWRATVHRGGHCRPRRRWPVFDAGRIRANIAVQDARTKQQLTTYVQTVLTALEGVENALVAYSREQVRRVQLADAVALATDLYCAGLDTFLNVLDSQCVLFASQSHLAQSEATIATNMVALYKALGGLGDPGTDAGKPHHAGGCL